MTRTNYAAVVHSFDRPPRYEPVETPVPSGEHEVLVDVLAAGLHPRVRSSANGSHYTSTGELPLIPGVDGVGRTPDGELVYFVLLDTPHGSMAEQTVIDRRRAVPLPADSDVIAIAAAMNPAMSSWLALRKRIDFQPGQSVLVLGAAGNAGRLALQVAAHLGAAEVRGAARPDLTEAGLAPAADVDVVLDYLWGEPAALAIRTLVTHRRERARPLDWIQIGAVAGPDLQLPSAALRAANLRILGSGQGSIGTAEMVAELPALAAQLTAGAFTIDAVPRPLRDVEAAWSAPGRIVFTPR
ncbi:MAG TPA: zinc-binding alcohol dehydrogenase family protein [Solirubrobacter sp.]|nr:zinc-binding alcohol dehydrogenase family protein [Solirubrobacter sp.]